MYNAEAYIEQTLAAILDQDYKHFEIIIIDDHSNDSSKKIVNETYSGNEVVSVHTNPKKGASSARNQAYKLSKGEYIIFFDADDWIPKNFVQTQLSALKSNSEVVVAKWGRFEKNDLSTIQVDKNQISKDLTFAEWIKAYWKNSSNMTCPGRVLIPRSLIEQSGIWDEDLTLNDDFPFYMRLFSKSDIIRFNNDTLFYYRSGINGLSSKNDNQGNISYYKSLERSVNVALNTFEHDTKVSNACANLLQNFVYELYPKQPELLKLANQRIKELGGADYAFPAGGKTKLLSSVFGWKLTKRLKLYFNF